MDKNIKAILLMGGKGARFGSSIPKQFHRIFGKKIYLHTLERFLENGLFQEIILVCCPEWREEVENDLSIYGSLPVKIINGGETRQESSFLGLRACSEKTDIVVIHDAVRPFVSQKILQANVASAIAHGAADTCIPSADTVVYSEDGKEIASIPNRAHYLRGQTPQSFSYRLILQAHLRTQQTNASDDCRLAIESGHSVAIVPGEEINLKITTELDLFLAEQLWKQSASLSHPTCSLKNKRFAITGGTGGIGSALAHLLEKEGAVPLLLSTSSTDYPLDLTVHANVKKTFEDLGPLDGLINSIGLFSLKKIEEQTALEIEKLIAANYTSIIFACQCAQIKERGHIVNIASSSYSRGRKNYAVYSSAKAAVVNFTQGLAEERPHLCINAVVPQRTDTAMRRTSFPNEDPNTLLSPETVAQAIVQLLKQDGVTGSLIEVRLDLLRN